MSWTSAAAPPSAAANEAGGRRGRASPSGSACNHRRPARASLVLAGRALRVPVASVPDGQPRTTAVGMEAAELRHRQSIPAGRSAGTRLPSSGPLGPHWGHIRATNDRIAADNSSHQRSYILAAHRQSRPSAAGRHRHPALSRTEEARGSNPLTSTPKPRRSERRQRPAGGAHRMLRPHHGRTRKSQSSPGGSQRPSDSALGPTRPRSVVATSLRTPARHQRAIPAHIQPTWSPTRSTSPLPNHRLQRRPSQADPPLTQQTCATLYRQVPTRQPTNWPWTPQATTPTPGPSQPCGYLPTATSPPPPGRTQWTREPTDTGHRTSVRSDTRTGHRTAPCTSSSCSPPRPRSAGPCCCASSPRSGAGALPAAAAGLRRPGRPGRLAAGKLVGQGVRGAGLEPSGESGPVVVAVRAVLRGRRGGSAAVLDHTWLKQYTAEAFVAVALALLLARVERSWSWRSLAAYAGAGIAGFLVSNTAPAGERGRPERPLTGHSGGPALVPPAGPGGHDRRPRPGRRGPLPGPGQQRRHPGPAPVLAAALPVPR
jgi:hypothetical protein